MILTLAVYAQSKEPKAPTLKQMMDAKTPDQVEKEQQADTAYRESLKKFRTLKLLLTHGKAFCPFSCFFRVLLKTLLWRRCFA